MNNHHPYNDMIEDKLKQLPAADVDLLWNDMHLILDKRMPQKKERRRFIMWFFSRSGSLLLLLIALIAGSGLFYLFIKENSRLAEKEKFIVNINETNNSLQTNDLTETGATRIYKNSEENLLNYNNRNQKKSVTINKTGSLNADLVADLSGRNNLFAVEAKQKSGTKSKNEFNSPGIEEILTTHENMNIAAVNLNSVHQEVLLAAIDKKQNVQLPEPIIKKPKISARNNETGFYSGIMSGIDVSSIHMKAAKTGATTGVILGYNINRKWSIESGVYWDTKRIYDDGSHFSPSGISPANGIEFIAVNGKSRLYEWPVNIKYSILSGTHGLFATAGLSSYFMRVENYDYEYTRYNQPGGHNYVSYKNETKDWFSVVNVSVGYTHKLGEIGSLRVEPYVKLPIKNIGIGNMPIMSTGLNIGFTRKLR